MQAEAYDAAVASHLPSQPRVPDSRLPGFEAEDVDRKKADAPQPLLTEEGLRENSHEFSLVALWPVFVMLTLVIGFTITTAWYGPKKVLHIVLENLVPPRPTIRDMIAIWFAIVGCITLGIPVLLLLLPVPTMMFGFYKGYVLTVTAEIAAACISFAVGRYVAQRPIRQYLEGRDCKRIMRLLHVLEEDESQSMQLLILYRFMTMPMAARNYGPAILRVPMMKLVVSTIPHSLWSGVVFATAGSALKGPAQLLRDGHKIAWRTPHWQQIVGLLIAVLSFTAFSWIAYRAYSRKVESEQTALVLKGSEEGVTAVDYGTNNGGMIFEARISDS